MLAWSEEAGQDEKIDGPVVGIDLGTTYSCVAIMKGDRVEVIPNEQGSRITPSVVTYSPDGERLVGEAAKNLRLKHPDHTFYDVKRLIGRGFKDKTVQGDMKHFPFKVVNKGGRPVLEVKTGGKTKQFAPEEVSAAVLEKMKTVAETYLGEPVGHAVVTVPAYFNDNQRSATKAAGAIAGLNVVRIVNEPTAAAIAFGLDRKDDITALVYDLGGGTFDVSILMLSNGVFQTVATAGDTHLGGEDFDQKVVDFALKEFKKKHKMAAKATPDQRAMAKLRREVEKGKRALSTKFEVTIEVEAFLDGKDLAVTLTRAKFEELCSELFKRTLAPVKQVLDDAGMEKNEINEVVMVGGSTRIPKVQELIKEFFELKELTHKVNPDEAVAYGAAIQAGILYTARSGGEHTKDLLLIDVTPLSLGTEDHDGRMVVFIKRNTVLPASDVQEFTTTEDYQTEVNFPVYEGERKQAKHNNKLGEFVLSGLAPVKAGVPNLNVMFQIDTNGILEVTAKDEASGREVKAKISADKGRLSDEKIEKMVKNAAKHAEEDAEFERRSDAMSAATEYVSSVKKSLLVKGELWDAMSEEERKSVKAVVTKVGEWLNKKRSGALPPVDQTKKQQDKVKDVADPIITRLYGDHGSEAMGDDEEGGDPSMDYEL